MAETTAVATKGPTPGICCSRAQARQLWAYSGFALETQDSGEYRMVRGRVRRNRERLTVLGLNDNHNHDLQNLFKGAALSASTRPGPLYDFYVALTLGLLGSGSVPSITEANFKLAALAALADFVS